MNNTITNQFHFINKLDNEKKKSFKNRTAISFIVLGFYFLIILFAFLADNTLAEWNKNIIDSNNVKGFFALLFVGILYLPLCLSVNEAISLAFDKKNHKNVFCVLVFVTSLLYFIPLIFLISSIYFLNFFENLFNFHKSQSTTELYLVCLYVIYLSLFFNTILILIALNVFLKIYKKDSFRNVVILNFLLTFVPFGFFGFALIGLLRGWSTIFFILISIAGTDVMCYLSGMLFGKTKMAKVISPNKTWEGAIIGTITTIVLMLSYCGFFTLDQKIITYTINGENTLPKDISISRSTLVLWSIGEFQTKKQSPDSVPLWIILGFVSCGLIISSILGDLLFSYIKRTYEIKDFGNALKSHGGFLDRFDSFVMTSSIYLFFTLISLGLFALSKNIEIIFGLPALGT